MNSPLDWTGPPVQSLAVVKAHFGIPGGSITSRQLHSVIHRNRAAVTVPAEASGDQSAEKGSPSHRGPTPQMGDTPPT